MYTFGQKIRMGWGKIRRSFLIAFRKDRVLEKLDRRRGACSRCGACCKLVFNCPAYDDSDGSPKCLVYNDRPGVCGLFPLDEKDLKERDLVSPGRACGFTFSDEPRPASEPLRESMPLRWGPPKGKAVSDIPDTPGKPSWVKGPWAIIWAYFNLKPKKPDAGSNGQGNGSPV